MSNLREQDKVSWIQSGKSIRETCRGIVEDSPFLKAYFGTDCRIDEIEEAIRPFAAIRALYMQSMEGQIIPPFQKWVLDALAKGSFEA
jgi:hypothetical protein